jgi:hypothetical protein
MRLGQPTLSTFLASPVVKEEQNALMIQAARMIQGDILVSQKAFKRAMRAYAKGAVVNPADVDMSTFTTTGPAPRATYDMWRRVLGAASAADLSDDPTTADALRTGVSLLKMLCSIRTLLLTTTPEMQENCDALCFTVGPVADANIELMVMDAALDAGLLQSGLARLAAAAAVGKSCLVCGRRPGTPDMPKLRLCMGCRAARYCGVACQQYAWAKHSFVCHM